MKFAYNMGTSFTKLRLFFHNVSFIIDTLFPPLHEMLYGGHVNPLAKASELFTHAVFQLVVCKMASLESILQWAKKDGSQRVLNWDCREDMGE
jgi:hypothetical protein